MFSFTREEIIQLTISMAVIAIAFSWRYLITGGLAAFAYILPIIGIGVGSGFILHELGHKFTAQRYGARAYYQSWQSGLMFTLLGALATGGRLVFAAPGAVYIYSRYIDAKKNAVISVAGPLVNLALAAMFAVQALFMPSDSYLMLIAIVGAQINLFLGVFNMIPFPPLDGSKVFRYSPIYWGIVVAAFIGVSFLFGIPIF